MKAPLCSSRRSTFNFILALLFLLIPATAMAQQITLTWDRNTESHLAGYNLYHRLASQSYDYNSPIWTGQDNTCTLTGVSETDVHYFVVRAFSTGDIESGNSNEISWNLIANGPPNANAGADQTVYEGAMVTLDGSKSSDPDDGIAYYLWDQSAATGAILSDLSQPKPTFTAPQVDADTKLTFKLTVTDRSGASHSDTVMITVKNSTAAQPPGTDPGSVPLEISGIWAASGKAYQIAHNLDNGSTCYLDRGYIYKNVPEFLKGATFIQTSNSDKERTNNPFLTFQANSPVTVYVAFDDRAQLPAWMSSFADTGADLKTDVPFSIYEKSFPPGAIQLGGNGHKGSMYTVIVTGNGTSPSLNHPPVANAGPDQSANERDFVLLSGLDSSDPDGAIASYHWIQTAGTAVELSDPSAVEPSFICPDVSAGNETLAFQLTVTDYSAASASDSVNITVSDILNPLPLEITNTYVASGKTYPITRNLNNGSTCYIDRDYIYSNVPEFLRGATFIQTSNSDKTSTNNPFLSFQVDRPVTVYVAFDDRAQLPNWMTSFVDTGFNLKTDVTFSIYEKDVPAGTVHLGGNGHNGSMYTVIVVEN